MIGEFTLNNTKYHQQTFVSVDGTDENSLVFRSAVFVFRDDDDVFIGRMGLEEYFLL